MSPRDLALTLLVVFIWGASFIAIKIGVMEMPPIFVTGLRFLFSAVPAIAFIKRPAVPWYIIIGYGVVLGAIKFCLLFLAIGKGMPIGLASVVVQMQVFFTIFLVFLTFGERPTRFQMIGGAVAFIGIVIFGAARSDSFPVVPFLLVLGAAFFWGVANTIGKAASNSAGGKVDMLAFVVWASLAAAPPLFLLSWIFEGGPAMAAAVTQITFKAVLSIAFMSVIATVFGFGLWGGLLSRNPVAKVAPFALLIPIIGMFSGVVFFGERLSATILFGTAIVFLGLLINVFGDRLSRRLLNRESI